MSTDNMNDFNPNNLLNNQLSSGDKSPVSEPNPELGSTLSRPKSLLNFIRNYIYGTEVEYKAEEVDTALKRISNSVLNKDPKNIVDMMKSTISSALEKDEDFAETFFETFFPQDKETIGRLNRYVNANEICDNITYCARALKVITDSIISPDDISKKSINITTTDQVSDSDEKVINLLKIISSKIVEPNIWNIIYNTLKYGDCFVEVVDYKSKAVPLSQSILRESNSKYGIDLRGESIADDEPEILVEVDLADIPSDLVPEDSQAYEMIRSEGKFQGKVILEIEDCDLIFDERKSNEIREVMERGRKFIEEVATSMFEDVVLSGSPTNNEDRENSEKKEIIRKDDTEKIPEIEDETDEVNISDISILIHNPWQVVKIQSRRFKTCLGYLVLPDVEGSDDPLRYVSTLSKTSTSTTYSTSLIGLGDYGSSFSSAVDNLYRNIVERISDYVKNDEVYIDKKEISVLLKRMIAETSISSSKDVFRVRYVPESRMEHFRINAQRFFPYGEGIFHKVTFLAKLLIALETATTIRRISDSVDKRVIYVESGPRDYRNRIEKVKEQMRRKKFSIDSLGSVGSVPSLITAFEDIYIPMIRGRRVIELDTLPSNVNYREIIDELKFMRDSIVSMLEVPPSYLNLEENLSNRTALSYENSIFAETIKSYQSMLNPYLRSLFVKIFKLSKGGQSISDSIVISFPSPKQLQLEREADRYDISLRLINALTELGVNREWAIRRYVDLPWDEIDAFNIKKAIEQRAFMNTQVLGQMNMPADYGGSVGMRGGMSPEIIPEMPPEEGMPIGMPVGGMSPEESMSGVMPLGGMSAGGDTTQMYSGPVSGMPQGSASDEASRNSSSEQLQRGSASDVSSPDKLSDEMIDRILSALEKQAKKEKE